MAPRPLDDDAAAFVDACWPDLEAVALVALRDPVAARRVTTEACADVVRDWTSTGGAPTAAARRALLTRLSRPARRAERSGTPDGAPTSLPAAAPGAPAPRDPSPGGPAPVPPGASSPPAAEDIDVREALRDALVTEPPLVRAGLVALVRWDLVPDEVSDLAASGSLSSDELRAGVSRLRAARRRALVTDPGPTAGDHADPHDTHPHDRHLDDTGPHDPFSDPALRDDVERVLDDLTADRPPPVDPAALVAARRTGARRRTLVVGGAAAIGLAGVGWGVGRGAVGDDATGTPFTQEARPADGAPAWDSATTWPVRGTLAGDAAVQGLARTAGPTARVVYADDVEGARVVVAALPGPRPGITSVRVWAGTVGAPAAQLTPIPYRNDRTETEDVLTIGVPHPVGAVLLVLIRPTERAAYFSPEVRVSRAGSVERGFRSVLLEDGVGHLRRDDPWGVAARVRVGEHDGPVLFPEAWGDLPSVVAASGPRTLRALVASATGVPESRLEADVLVDSVTDGSVLDPFALSPLGGDGRTRVTSVTTPSGGVVRTVHVEDDGRAAGRSLDSVPLALPAWEARAPVVVPLGDVPPRTGRFLVVVPGGGESCQLLGTNPAAYPVSKVTPMREDTAVVEVVNARDASGFRLVVTAADGTRTYDAVPPIGRPLVATGREGSAFGRPPAGTGAGSGTPTTRGPAG
ncbi:hypothetical protein KC207_01255 [Phycicoccus sp. BSK3Z-2]|uniref:Uncharacterized protein n=1 Tax=Phycicoccus avicenniae TaxID=2828860 RepID=A0A941D6A6_9MICO|nr:hypothetical protein [Phycicoccus avicenniae]MBR7741918.1 hypothetical protein [Phycicoccus avicenniae]